MIWQALTRKKLERRWWYLGKRSWADHCGKSKALVHKTSSTCRWLCMVYVQPHYQPSNVRRSKGWSSTHSFQRWEYTKSASYQCFRDDAVWFTGLGSSGHIARIHQTWIPNWDTSVVEITQGHSCWCSFSRLAVMPLTSLVPRLSQELVDTSTWETKQTPPRKPSLMVHFCATQHYWNMWSHLLLRPSLVPFCECEGRYRYRHSHSHTHITGWNGSQPGRHRTQYWQHHSR
jgi:hypothetical protein